MNSESSSGTKNKDQFKSGAELTSDYEPPGYNQDGNPEETLTYIWLLDERLSECEKVIGKSDDVSGRSESTIKNIQGIDAVQERVRRLEENTEELTSSQEDIKNRIEKEFDTIEDVFKRFLRDIENLETRINQLAENQQNNMQLKREALRIGVKEGHCEECDEEINISQLVNSACPNCRKVFTGISKNSWIPFKSPVLETRPEQADPADTSPEEQSDFQFTGSDETEGR
jgi:chromosome segregation ATPase